MDIPIRPLLSAFLVALALPALAQNGATHAPLDENVAEANVFMNAKLIAIERDRDRIQIRDNNGVKKTLVLADDAPLPEGGVKAGTDVILAIRESRRGAIVVSVQASVPGGRRGTLVNTEPLYIPAPDSGSAGVKELARAQAQFSTGNVVPPGGGTSLDGQSASGGLVNTGGTVLTDANGNLVTTTPQATGTAGSTTGNTGLSPANSAIVGNTPSGAMTSGPVSGTVAPLGVPSTAPTGTTSTNNTGGSATTSQNAPSTAAQQLAAGRAATANRPATIGVATPTTSTGTATAPNGTGNSGGVANTTGTTSTATTTSGTRGAPAAGGTFTNQDLGGQTTATGVQSSGVNATGANTTGSATAGAGIATGPGQAASGVVTGGAIVPTGAAAVQQGTVGSSTTIGSTQQPMPNPGALGADAAPLPIGLAVQSFEASIARMAAKADEVDSAFARYKEACVGLGSPVGHIGARSWLDIWDGATVPTETRDQCEPLLTNALALGASVKQGVQTAEEMARRSGVLPGVMRQIRAQYGMDWGGWER